jgi:hypothetical protein
MKSSLHRLIPFLPWFCNCQFRRLHSIQFLCSKAGRMASRSSTPHSRLLFYCASTLPNISYNHFARTTQRIQPVFFTRRVVTAPFPSNRRPIVARVGSCGNVFTESLPSNGHTRHSTYEMFGRLHIAHEQIMYSSCIYAQKYFLRHVRDEKTKAVTYLILKYFDLDDLNNRSQSQEIPPFLWTTRSRHWSLSKSR